VQAISLNAFDGTSYGEVMLNGKELSSEVFKKHCYVVSQNAVQWPSLTCGETLTYAAQLHLGRSATEVETFVNNLLQKTGLLSCKVSPCVNFILKSLIAICITTKLALAGCPRRQQAAAGPFGGAAEAPLNRFGPREMPKPYFHG